MRPRLLVLGRNGQLATSVRNHSKSSNFSLVSAGRAECDMRNAARLREFLAEQKPDIILNTAAYTDVEAAEGDPWASFTLNATAVRNVADFCESAKIPLIHISTDYVYDGEKGAPYTEEDEVSPISVYGCSKALGDIAVMDMGGLVLRTAWLFSGHNRNFARTMMNLAERRDVVRVVDDQFGNPTCADDLAGIALDFVDRMLAGEALPTLLLTAGEPAVSWADLAEAVFEAMEQAGKKRPRLERIPATEFPTRARRPRDSRFSMKKLHEACPQLSLDWRSRVAVAVEGHLRELEKTEG